MQVGNDLTSRLHLNIEIECGSGWGRGDAAAAAAETRCSANWEISQGVRGAVRRRGPGVGFGGPPAGVDLVKGAQRRRIRARADRSPFYALFPAPRAAAAANPAGPRRGRRPQIASQSLPTDSLSAPHQLYSKSSLSLQQTYCTF